MSTSTSTSTWTRVHTATHLSGAMLGAIAEILAHLGIDTTRLGSRWRQDDAAITAWISEGSLDTVILECQRPDGTVDPVIEFPVTYTASGAASGGFTADRASLARYLDKLRAVPRGTTHRLVVTYRGPASSQPGWGPTTRASTGELTSRSFGTFATGPHASAAMRYHRS